VSVRETVDLNCDLGESYGNWRCGNDEEIMPLLSAANVACGFHAGDPVTMLRTVRLCQANGVAVGAHPGLPDKLGFGRRIMDLSPDDVYADVVYQVGALVGALASTGTGAALNHSKPHGGFYIMVRDRPDLGDAAAAALADVAPEARLYWPAPVRGAMPDAARRRGIEVIGEVNPDLLYDETGTIIVERIKREADLDRVARQVEQFLRDSSVSTTQGTRIEVEADSIGIHGDGPNAVDVAATVHRVAGELGCVVQPLAASVAGAEHAVPGATR
jgi:UPF0271 protein